MKKTLVVLAALALSSVAFASGPGVYHQQLNTSSFTQSPIPGGTFYPHQSTIVAYNWDTVEIRAAGWVVGPNCYQYPTMTTRTIAPNGGWWQYTTDDADSNHRAMFAWCRVSEGEPVYWCQGGVARYRCQP